MSSVSRRKAKYVSELKRYVKGSSGNGSRDVAVLQNEWECCPGLPSGFQVHLSSMFMRIVHAIIAATLFTTENP